MASQPLDLSALFGDHRPDGVRAITVSTLTGSSTVDGRSKTLGNETDSALLVALREWADVIIVGAHTVRAENYYGAQPNAAKPQPAAMAVPSRSLEFDYSRQFFDNFVTPHVFLTPSDALADPAVARRAAELRERGFDVIDTGAGTPADMLAECHRRGWRNISLEGGPTLLGAFAEADLVDKLYLTLDPRLSARPETPVAAGRGPVVHRRMWLENVATDDDGTVLLRYTRAAGV